eukprot:4733322-Amphidinium_carterae.2
MRVVVSHWISNSATCESVLDSLTSTVTIFFSLDVLAGGLVASGALGLVGVVLVRLLWDGLAAPGVLGLVEAALVCLLRSGCKRQLSSRRCLRLCLLGSAVWTLLLLLRLCLRVRRAAESVVIAVVPC